MEQKRSRKWYIVAGVVLVALVAVLWIRYAGTQKRIRELDSRNPRIQANAARILLERQVLEDSLPAQPEERRAHAAAALALVVKGTSSEKVREAAMKQLVALIKDPEDLPQRAASRAMGSLGLISVHYLAEDWDTQKPVIQDGDDRAKAAAVDALGKIGEPAVPALTKALGNKDRREQAAIALGKIRGAGLEPLLKHAWSKDEGLRKICIKVLGEVKERRAIPAAIDALKLKGLRQTAIIALGLIADPHATAYIIPYLKDLNLRTDTATALGEIGDVRAVAPLLAELRDPERQFHNRAVWALQRIGRPGAPLLTQALRSGSAYVRRAAAESFRWIALPETIPALVGALHDPDVKVRVAAASALGWADNAAGVEPLLAALGDPAWQVADAAVNALADVGSPAVEPLIGLFNSADPVKQMLASNALTAMSKPPVQRLLQATYSSSDPMREWAALTLGKIGDTAAKSRLQQLVETSQGNVKWAAREALRRLGALAAPAGTS
jgi:HEAT repeat protein